MHRKTKIFLSHTFLDNNPVKRRLISNLENLSNIGVWRAKNHITAGDRLFSKISEAISQTDYFVHIIGDKQGAWSLKELELALASELVKQNVKVIKAVTYGVRGDGTLVGRESRGIVINFCSDYDGELKLLRENIGINSSDSLIKFDLDAVTATKPILVITNEQMRL
jgi:hypothetical protein